MSSSAASSRPMISVGQNNTISNTDDRQAQRLHDLGQSSKDSWIKRFFKNIFKPEEQSDNHDSNQLEQETQLQMAKSNEKPPGPPKPKLNEVNVLPPIEQTNTKVANIKNEEIKIKQAETHVKFSVSAEDIRNEHNIGVDPKPPKQLPAITNKPTNLSTLNGVVLPPSLQNSPYLQKEQTAYRLPKLKDAQSPNRSQTSSASTIAKLSKSNTAIGLSDLEKSYQGNDNGELTVRKQQLIQSAGSDSKKDTVSKASLVSAVQLERKARAATDKAMKAGKVFTCFAPYPVDAFVRHSLRKRGWVEKFSTKLLNLMSNPSITSNKFQCSTDEDFEIICDQSIPKPWEEDNGIYSIMSRQVSRAHPKFIWGNKSVNNLVLRNDVIVNHFPKAKYFNSKVLLAESLRDLPWQNNSTSNNFFPRCYLLKDTEESDIIDDFRTTACITMLRIAIKQGGGDKRNSYLEDNNVSNNSKNLNKSKSASINGRASSLHGNGWQSRQKTSDNFRPMRTNYADDSSIPDMRDHTFEEELDSDLPDNVSNHILYSKFGPAKVIPDLELKTKHKQGGTVPAKAIQWALHHCDLFVRSKSHEDIDKNRRGLTYAQWEQFLTWFEAASQESAAIELSSEHLNDCKNMLQKMESVWPQMEIDGLHNIWIVKPGDKSKGIGIKFLTKIEDIIEYIHNPETTDYVLQKYIERPLLIYNCKFDIRQWFLVTEWQPLTVWFYKISYLRICSQEFTYDSLHESVHLSNVAVQENYVNGKRSDKLPDNNFLTSEQFKEYLSETGVGEAWEERIYPGMKEAVLNTLIATQEITDSRKSGFELYGGDFMISEDYNPWLLEVNSSPGMLPSSIDKAKLCASVIEDTIKVVLDHKENSNCDTGKFELIYRDTINPNTRGSDCKLMLEGNRITRNELQKYSLLDQNTKKLLEECETKLKDGEEVKFSVDNTKEPVEEFSRFQRNVVVSEGIIIQSASRLSNRSTSQQSGEVTAKQKIPAIKSNSAPSARGKGKKKNSGNVKNRTVNIYGGSAGSRRPREAFKF